MSTPQKPAVRNKQKRRRTKQLAAWRVKNEEKTASQAGEGSSTAAKK